MLQQPREQQQGFTAVLLAQETMHAVRPIPIAGEGRGGGARHGIEAAASTGGYCTGAASKATTAIAAQVRGGSPSPSNRLAHGPRMELTARSCDAPAVRSPLALWHMARDALNQPNSERGVGHLEALGNALGKAASTTNRPGGHGNGNEDTKKRRISSPDARSAVVCGLLSC
jgi:hypothetical protein